MTSSGMNKQTGRALKDIDHIRQSIADILTTPVGSRIMRRDYGSMIFELIDQPQNPATNLKLMAATVMAIMAWEPRIIIEQIEVDGGSVTGSVTIGINGRRASTEQPVNLSIEVTA